MEIWYQMLGLVIFTLWTFAIIISIKYAKVRTTTENIVMTLAIMCVALFVLGTLIN